MPTLDERMTLIERRVTGLEVAHDRDIEFIAKKLVDHSSRLESIEDKVDRIDTKVDKLEAKFDKLEAKVDKLGGAVAQLSSAFEAFPSIIARTLSETLRAEFAARDKPMQS